MNLPAGKTVKKLETGKADFVNEISQLMKSFFTGYVVITIEGYSGIEEGILFFNKGQLVGASFEYPKFETTVFGDSAAKQFFNALAAKYSVADVCELSKQQLELITTFNEKIILDREITGKNLLKLVPKEYTPEYAKKTLGKALEKQESMRSVFKRAGLSVLDKCY